MSVIVDGIIGHAIGDAMGVPVEFKDRESLMYNPVLDMRRSYAGDKGTWSDDTSMEIATIDSYINNNGWNYDDIMINFGDWINDSRFTAHDYTFDVGRTCLTAIRNYLQKGTPAIESGLDDINSNGNGSLMRMLPVAYYCFFKKSNKEEIYDIVKNISSLTHRHEISILGCYIYVLYVINLLQSKNKDEAYYTIQNEDYSMFSSEAVNCYKRVLNGELYSIDVDNIKSTGYVVDTLEASIWVLLQSKDYKESIIGSVNLGGDTDTIGAITGSMSGILYGFESFPKEWVNDLARKDYIIELCNKFENCLVNNNINEINSNTDLIDNQEQKIKRFLEAHKKDYFNALLEIKNGHKESHWMWYIFPQLADLGESSTSKYYGIKDLDEAKLYLEDYVLKSHLIEISNILYSINDDISNIFDYPDDLKLKSCMTLFNCADPTIEIFEKVLNKFFDGEKDQNTLNLLRK